MRFREAIFAICIASAAAGCAEQYSDEAWSAYYQQEIAEQRGVIARHRGLIRYYRRLKAEHDRDIARRAAAWRREKDIREGLDP